MYVIVQAVIKRFSPKRKKEEGAPAVEEIRSFSCVPWCMQSITRRLNNGVSAVTECELHTPIVCPRKK
ncbi:hypothetical protein EVAR_29467_1 [Eumeta japonica]|uniref:Uncharacterized protein n=1 Tax=Eumeta variegata TaxID=151549 RepID=A0A4C1WSZ3_EUMVA|nr:hypothetical protein EVAR_29467_1 [Eumeta japonica]